MGAGGSEDGAEVVSDIAKRGRDYEKCDGEDSSSRKNRDRMRACRRTKAVRRRAEGGGLE